MHEETKEVLNVVKDMFTELSNQIRDVQNDVKEVKQRVTNVEERLTNVEERLTNVENDVKEVKMTLENETNRNITLLVDGYIANAEKLDKLQPVVHDVKNIKMKTEVIELAVKSHSHDINRLKQVK